MAFCFAKNRLFRVPLSLHSFATLRNWLRQPLQSLPLFKIKKLEIEPVSLHFIFGILFFGLYLILFYFYHFFMTLKVRNRILQFFLVFSCACITSALICFIIALINKAITPPPVFRVPAVLSKTPLLNYSFTATMLSISLLVIFAPVAAWHLMKFFQATQASEVIFFMAFLTACLFEGLRFLTPLFGLWATFSDFLFFCGRLLFMCRLLAPLSFVFAALASSADQRQEIERNITVLFAVCIVFSVIAPINTAKITSAGTITWGFSKLFLVSRLIFIVIAFISFWINSKNNEEPDYAKMGIYMLVMLAGYGFMITADNFVFMIMGMPLLVYGCVKYLKTLHQIYLWK